MHDTVAFMQISIDFSPQGTERGVSYDPKRVAKTAPTLVLDQTLHSDLAQQVRFRGFIIGFIGVKHHPLGFAGCNIGRRAGSLHSDLAQQVCSALMH
jgi:hypothetical protein